MAKGDKYNVLAYAWQVRERADGRVFIRYDSLPIDSDNKGRYNTSPIVKVETNNVGQVRFTTESGSQYYFTVAKCVYPMQLLALTMKFGVEF
jgi:hypothetical protein